MESSLFEYDDYKAYVLDRLEGSPQGGRGLRRKMAEAMGCQIAYVSHVLAGDRHFSLEQAEALTRFFSLRGDETEFFLLLVDYNRAGTVELRKVLKRQMAARRENYQQLKNRVQMKAKITAEDQALYYSSTHYQEVGMLTMIPQYRTAPAIAQKLGLPIERVTDVLSFLMEKGLVREHEGEYIATDASMHLGSDSPLISKLHSNWRIHTLKTLDRQNTEDLHYSSLVTLSHEDFQKVREIMVKAMLDSHKVIMPSKEERMCVLAMDFYEI